MTDAKKHTFENQRNDGEQDGQERRSHSRELRTLSEWSGDEKRPASECQAEEDVYDKDQQDVGKDPDLGAPNEGNDNPRGKIHHAIA